jgi:hypothetical protein
LRLRGTKQEAIAEAGNPKQSVRGLAIASYLAMTGHDKLKCARNPASRGPSLRDAMHSGKPWTVSLRDAMNRVSTKPGGGTCQAVTGPGHFKTRK